MTPKEKAVDLIKKHLETYDITPIAIKSAMITVDEIIKEFDSNPKTRKEEHYWYVVKKELEDLEDTIELYQLG